MPDGDRPLDPYQLASAEELPGQTLDGERTVCLAELSDGAATAALVGLANGHGGHLLLGAELDLEQGSVRAVPGVDGAAAGARLRELARRIEPPLDELVQVRALPARAGRQLLVATVRQSPRPPHIDPASGLIYLGSAAGIQPVRSRAALDALYEKGKAERDRAERLIEAMIERLMLAHYAYYGIGVLACLQLPAADAYLWAREFPGELATPDDAFIAEWEFTPEQVRVRPGEVELRTEREVAGLLRVQRAGCVAAGETRRRPPGDILGTPAELGRRIEALVETACRVLAHAEAPVIVPRLFCEGLKSTRLITARQPYAESTPSSVDTLQMPGATGDPHDPAYRQALSRAFLERLCALYQVDVAAAD